jgi:hypothetical protein
MNVRKPMATYHKSFVDARRLLSSIGCPSSSPFFPSKFWHPNRLFISRCCHRVKNPAGDFNQVVYLIDLTQFFDYYLNSPEWS